MFMGRRLLNHFRCGLLCIGVLLCGAVAHAQTRALPAASGVKNLAKPAGNGQRTPAGNLATGEVDRPLRIEGQARNLNMMLMLKGEKDRIKFGEVRETYVEDVKRTNY